MTEEKGEPPPRVQWEGLSTTGASYMSPQHHFLFHSKHISFVCQTTAVSPLLSVFTVWPYCSRVNIKDPGGYNT